jgi:RsiW-degrading membrane proteinase PrsW (M82 family)
MVIPVHKPRLTEKIFFFVSGTLVSVPLTLFVNSFSDYLCVLLPIFYARICSIAILTPFIEEFAKAYPLFYRHGETEKSLFTLGFLVGLGFGISEFLLYVFTLGAPIHVRLPGVFFHATSTSITAYGIATKRPILFYMTAVALHFLNNFSTLFYPLWFVVGPVALTTTYLLSWVLYRKTSEKIVS